MVMPTRALRTTGLTPFTVTDGVARRDAVAVGAQLEGGEQLGPVDLLLDLHRHAGGRHGLRAPVDERHLDRVVDVGDVARP